MIDAFDEALLNRSSAHERLLDELVEWFEDVAGDDSTKAQALVLSMPPRSGRTLLLERFRRYVVDTGYQVVNVEPTAQTLQAQATEIVEVLDTYASTSKVRAGLGLETPAGQLGAVISTATLAASPEIGIAGFAATHLVNIGVQRFGSLSQAAIGRVELAGSAVAKKSTRDRGVAVVMDNAEHCSGDLLRPLVSSLIGRPASQVLLVVLLDYDHPHRERLLNDRYGLVAERTHAIDGGIDGSWSGRLELASELIDDLPAELSAHVASRTSSIADVFEIAAAPSLRELSGIDDPQAHLSAIINSIVQRRDVSTLQATIAWLGGTVHTRLVTETPSTASLDQTGLRSTETTMWLPDPADPQLGAAVAALLDSSHRRSVAAAAVKFAADLVADEAAGHTERGLAGGPVWHLVDTGVVDLDDRIEHVLLATAEAALAQGWEQRSRAISEFLIKARRADGRAPGPALIDLLDRVDLLATVDAPDRDPSIAVRVAVSRLADPEQRQTVIESLPQLVAMVGRLDRHLADGHRLLLAAALCRAKLPSLAADLLAPLLEQPDHSASHALAQLALASGTPQGQQFAARAVLKARHSALAETDVAARAAIADAIADLSDNLGDYRSALQYGSESLGHKIDELGPGHPDTLDTRSSIARFTGYLGEYARALQLFQQLLLDQQRVLGLDHPSTLATRNSIAFFTGKEGEAAKALQLLEQLLLDRQRVLGLDHPSTLATRHNIALFTGETGEPAEALQLFRPLLSEQQRVLGPDHRETLATRSSIAHFTGTVGEPARALQLFQQLLPDQQRVLGLDHPSTLATRHNIALFTGETGQSAEALQLFRQLLSEQQRVLGPDHRDRLATRHNIAHLTKTVGEPTQALHLFQQLLSDRQRVLSPDHPDTLTTRHDIAHLTEVVGEPAQALHLFQQLLPEQQRVLSPDHPDTLATRHNIARLNGETGEPVKALQLFQKLLPEQQRVLGPDHPDTLATRHSIASWIGQTGEPARALQLFQQLLPDRQRVFGPDHPDVLTTRSNIAFWMGQTGEPAQALHLYQHLLPVEQRVLGPDHRDTLTTRSNIASLTGRTGEPDKALQLYQQLLTDEQRVLGPDHRDTLTTRSSLAHWMVKAGGPDKALHLYQQLLPDQRRVLGPDEPATLTTRSNIAFYTGETGDRTGAIELFQQLLADQQRVLGSNHPSTLMTLRDISDLRDDE